MVEDVIVCLWHLNLWCYHESIQSLLCGYRYTHAKIVQTERNTKEKLVFLFISEVPPILGLLSKDSANRVKYKEKRCFLT